MKDLERFSKIAIGAVNLISRSKIEHLLYFETSAMVSHKIDKMEVVMRCAFLRHLAHRKSRTKNREREQAVV